MTETESLGTALPKEQERVRKLLESYIEIGPAGAFGAAFIRDTLKEAEMEVMSGDIARMITVYERLKEHRK